EDPHASVSWRSLASAAGRARAELPQVLEAVDAGAVTVGPEEREPVVAHRLDAVEVHRLRRRVEGELQDLVALAHRAGAQAAEQPRGELPAAPVAPGDDHT